MKGITTLAALPSGAGQAAALPAEVGEAKPEGVKGVKIPEGATLMIFDLGIGPDQCVTRTFTAGEIAKHFKVSPVRKAAVKCPFKFTDPDLLDTSK
jgi:hypothetical protein